MGVPGNLYGLIYGLLDVFPGGIVIGIHQKFYVLCAYYYLACFLV